MAVTTVIEPQDLSPAYNAMYFYFNSDDKTELGFRYVVLVIDQSTSEVIGTYRLKPIPVDLYGEVDISKLLQTTLFSDFQDTTTYIPDGHQTTYNLQINEAYFINLPFTGYEIASSTSWSNFGDVSYNPNGFARTMITFATLPPYLIGDEILIAQDPIVRPELEGVHTVIDIFLDTGVYYVVLDLTWIRSGLAATGDTSFADGRKSIIDGIEILGKQAYKGAFGFLDFRNYQDDNYILDQDDKLLLTTLPESVRISRVIPTWLSGYVSSGTAQYIVFDIGGTLYRYQITAINGKISLFNILPSDATITETWNGSIWVAFGGGLDLSDVESYTIQIFADNDPVSVIVTVTLYNDCDFHDKFDITFLDRLGSWITIPFYKGAYLNQEIERSTFRKKFGDYEGVEWSYESTDRGDQIYDVDENILYTVNSGILSEIESQYIRELMSTPQAFVTINNGVQQAITIENQAQPLYKKRTQRDRKVSLNFRMAVQDSING